ncbi:GNAT family N-acetyltransferase [Clostridium cochlearium]|uniref:GNAT family N-acetyltransferase n=1 Tax=Clostridium cochlearium TaxID=1494 RepID=A0A7Y3V7Y6_CLOCO|nr:GNAT family N-acetyltransferase [Clostridium cochlearium]
MVIRGAKPEDAEKAAELISMAWDELACIFAGSKDKEEVNKVISTFCKEKNNRFSYEYIDIAEKDGKIAGLVLAFPAEKEMKLNIPIIKKLPYMYKRKISNYKEEVVPMLSSEEAKPGEYYIDSIAVHPNYRKNGLGKKLLMVARKRALKKGFKKVSLIVKPKNKGAIKLYKSSGYNMDGTVDMPSTDYYRMVKKYTVEV